MHKTSTLLGTTAVVAVAAAVAIPVLSGAKAASDQSQTLRFYDKPAAMTLTQASGKVISRPPYPRPQPGDTLDVYSVDYVGSHAHHAKPWTMSNHLRCTFKQGPPVCDSTLATGNSLLVFDGNKIVGGTGAYLRATGRVLSNKALPGSANGSDIVVQVGHASHVTARDAGASAIATAETADTGARLDHRGLKDGPRLSGLADVGARLDHRGLRTSRQP
jgi:hypothetical protein